MTAPPVQWVTASPLWPDTVDEPERLRRPAILRFASDRFMDELGATLTRQPDGLVDRVAVPVSYRHRPPAAPPDWDPAPPDLKLFQPVHGHFNLVSASLVCRIPGMPDRLLDSAEEEAVGFVLRRLAPPVTEDTAASTPPVELAWVVDPVAGAAWQPVGQDRLNVVPGEELMPLFPMQFEDEGRRRLFVGLIPTGSVETFKAGGVLAPQAVDRAPDGTPIDPRHDALDTQVMGPLAELVRTKASVASAETTVQQAASQLRQEASEFLLLDLAEWLRVHAPDAWAPIRAGARPSGGAAQALYDRLEDARASAGSSRTIRALLVEAADKALRIADEGGAPAAMGVDLADATGIQDSGSTPAAPRFTTLRATIVAVLPAQPAPDLGPARPDVGAAGRLPKLSGTGARFVIRCVFRRPNCMPKTLDIVSDPTEPFKIAPFFDPDAPARTIRVELPVNTTIAELRKYPRNVGFAISSQLREQMSRVTDLEKTMKGELAAGESIDIGMLCSFSMPIITICALIVLLIFVSLLNIVFWWMPFLRICLPIALPGKRE